MLFPGPYIETQNSGELLDQIHSSVIIHLSIHSEIFI